MYRKSTVPLFLGHPVYIYFHPKYLLPILSTHQPICLLFPYTVLRFNTYNVLLSPEPYLERRDERRDEVGEGNTEGENVRGLPEGSTREYRHQGDAVQENSEDTGQF